MPRACQRGEWAPELLDTQLEALAHAAKDTGADVWVRRADHGAGRVRREAASDPLLTVVLAGLGVTSLSMAAPSLAEVRATLAEHTLAQCEAAAVAALAAATPADARAAAEEPLIVRNN